VARPYFKEMIEGVPPADSPDDEDPEIWKRELLSLNERIAQATEKLPTNGVVFCKHMAKHSDLYDFESEFKMDSVELIHRHLLLIRDPVDVLSSWKNAGGVHGDNPTSDEVGIIPLMVIYSKLESRMDGMQPVVVESDDLVSDPEGTLFWVCERLSVPFHQSMLTWESGKHKCDGPWARVSMHSGDLLLDLEFVAFAHIR
jgi:Sulfotransferase domain